MRARLTVDLSPVAVHELTVFCREAELRLRREAQELEAVGAPMEREMAAFRRRNAAEMRRLRKAIACAPLVTPPITPTRYRADLHDRERGLKPAPWDNA